MLQIAYEVFPDVEVAFVDRRHERQLVHVLEKGARRIMNNHASAVAVRQAADRGQLSAFRGLLDREVEFRGGDKIDRWGGRQALLRFDGDGRSDHADPEPRIGFLHRRRHGRVARERRRRRVQHREIEVMRLLEDVRCAEAVRRRVDQFAVRNERRRLREPGRIPERPDFAPRLISGARSAVEAVVGRSLKEKGSHRGRSSLWIVDERAVRLQAVALAAP